VIVRIFLIAVAIIIGVLAAVPLLLPPAPTAVLLSSAGPVSTAEAGPVSTAEESVSQCRYSPCE
jgi:hypothetical protein